MFDFITRMIDTLGALGVGVVMFLENVFPPIPSELVMPLAGFQAAQGQVSLIAIFVMGTIGAVAGAYLWFWVGQAIGRKRLEAFIDRYGVWLTLEVADVRRAIEWFDRHDKAAVFFGRMVPGIRTLISVPAGLSGMRLRTFFIYTTIGSAIWNAGLIAAGYLLSANYDRVAVYLNPVTNILLTVLLVWYVFRVLRKLISRSRG
ncbi:alkaline phosphatase [Loktanella sp. 3ANDIMAR09]|uniref:DedA family protein n=1 Tax=Loktanella sp. 3ANDIMAR09 TaxID=1225657 RepID=UPI0006FCAAAD|nr:DedA family protein [Loktanella sp. 3ANDIMAR09]KQI67820.1 alkaline phosphatase [Loktanella sp. 3ANDIMAR09]